MRKLLIAVILLSVLLALPLLAMRSERTLIAISHWAVETFTDYRLNLVQPVLRPFERNVAAAEIHLYPKGDDAPPFLTVLAFSGNIGWTDLYTANLEKTSLSARQVILYTSDTDATEDPDPRDWLSYLGWLPETLHIGQLHLVTAGEDIFIFPLEGINGGRPDPLSFRASARAQYEGEPLQLEVGVTAVREQEQITAIDLHSVFTALVSNSVVSLTGKVEGTAEDFHYDFQLNANYNDIAQFLRGFNARGKLQGRLNLDAQMKGNTEGFVLRDARFTLDNMPAYGIEAAGTLEYDIEAGGEVKLIAAGEISSMDVVLDWLDLDLHSLGRASGNAVVTGTIRNPVIERFRLRSEASNGLTVNVSGHIDPFRMEDRDNEVRLDIAGPNIATLQQWTGPLPFEPGAFSASGMMRGRDDSISLEDVVIEVGDPSELLFRLAGRAGRLDRMNTDGLAAARDIELTLSVDSPDSRHLSEILGMDVPPGFVLDGDLTLAGNGELLQPVSGLFTARSSDLDIILVPHKAEITPLLNPVLSNTQASVSITLSDVSALSQYVALPVPILGRVDGKAMLTQRGEQLALNDLQLSVDGRDLQLTASGAVASLAPFNQLSLGGRFSEVPAQRLLDTAFDDFNYPRDIGRLQGDFQLGYQGGRLDLRTLKVRTSDDQGPVRLDLTASASDLTGEFKANGDIDYQIRDPDLLEFVTGLRMNPMRAAGTFTVTPSGLTLEHQADIGQTRISLAANASHNQRSLTGVEAQIASPILYLADLGLQAQESTTATYNPSEQLEEADALEAFEGVLGARSQIPSDIRVNIDGIVGERTNINTLDIHITGVDNRYTLREFNVGYADTVGEIRGIIDLNARPPFVSIAGEAVAIPLNTLGRDIGMDANVRGELTVRGGLSSQGKNTTDLMADLDGSLSLALENAEFKGAAYDLLATDLLAWFYSGAAAKTSTFIDCTMASFQLLDGIASSDSLYIETKSMVATGDAELDMVAQQMDVKITPRSKSRALQVPSSVRLKGDFTDPRTTVSPIAAAFDAYAEVLSLVPRMARKVFGIKRNDRALRPCEAVQ